MTGEKVFVVGDRVKSSPVFCLPPPPRIQTGAADPGTGLDFSLEPFDGGVEVAAAVGKGLDFSFEPFDGGVDVAAATGAVVVAVEDFRREILPDTGFTVDEEDRAVVAVAAATETEEAFRGTEARDVIELVKMKFENLSSFFSQKKHTQKDMASIRSTNAHGHSG